MADSNEKRDLHDDAFEKGSAVGGQSSSMAFIEAPRVKALGQRGLVAVIAGSVLAGVVLTLLWTHVIGDFIIEKVETLVVSAAAPTTGMFPSTTLTGEGGSVTFPPTEPTVVHVWLQGCADCMPAFEAQKRHVDAGVYTGVPVVNVAYGQADATWARTYGVSDRLFFDPGSHVVQPLRIGTFTTFVVDEDGDIRFRGRPDQDGFAHRLAGALEATRLDPTQNAARAAAKLDAAKP
jgi:hypothetical protein